jgi:hypothetical protein
MAIFDPNPNTSVAYEQPVQQAPSTGMALAELGSSFGEAFLDYRQQKAEASVPDQDQAAMAQYQDTLFQAQAARSQGNTQRAEQLERDAALGLQRNGVSVNENTLATYTAITGRPGDELLLSPEQVQLNQVRGSQEYESAFLATYASGDDMSEEERDAMAISRVARQQGQAAMLQDQNIAWTQGRRDAFFSVVSDFEDAALGTLNRLAGEQGFVPQDAIRQATLGWSETKRALLSERPEGVTDKQWSQFEDRISQVDAELETISELSTAEGIEATLAADVAAAIRGSDWSAGKQLIGLSILSNPEIQATLSATLDIKDIAESVLSDQFELSTTPTQTEGTGGGTTNGGSTGGGTTPGVFDNLPEDVTAADAETNFRRARNLGALLNQTGPDSVSANPAYRNEFLRTSYVAFGAMNQIGEENRRFVTADGINETFNGKVVEGLRAAAQQNPVETENVVRAGVQALDVQFSIAEQQLTNTLSSSYLRRSRDGNIVLDESAVLQDEPVDQVRMLKNAVDEFYGGDIVALIDDRGRKLEGGRSELAFSGLISRISSGSSLTNARSQLASVNAINAKRQQFMGLLDETVETEQDPEVALQSSGATQVRGFEVIQGDQDFLNKTSEVASDLGVDPLLLLQTISFETVGTFDPSIKNPNSTATGLIQFIESTAKKLGTSTSELRGMNRTEQMDVVKKYLEPFKGRLNNLGDIYMAIHWPAGVGKDSSYVMYEQGTEEYRVNKTLDQNGDGVVTRGEAVSRVVESNRGGMTASSLPADQRVETTTLPSTGNDDDNSVSQQAVEEQSESSLGTGTVGTETPATQPGGQQQPQQTGQQDQPEIVFANSIVEQVPDLKNWAQEIEINLSETPYFESREAAERAAPNLESGQRILVRTENDLKVLEVE